MSHPPRFATTTVGSFPQKEAAALSSDLVAQLDIPGWPQLPRRNFRESMYVQYSAPLPATVMEEASGKLYFDTRGDLTEALEQFYTSIISDDVAAFALPRQYAAGFYALLEALQQAGPGSGWVKGQVTGPISFGLTVTDHNLRPSLYDETIADVIVKNTAFQARWQVRQLGALRPHVIISVDEPYLAAFGSSFISLSRAQVLAMLDEVFAAIHEERALASVHCCANTDWSVLLASDVDIINLDAYGYVENLALYPAELRAFLDRGGRIAWGIVPNDEIILETGVASLAQRWHKGMEHLTERAAARAVTISHEDLAAASLLTTSCGLGSTTPEIAEAALETLSALGPVLRA